MRAGLGGREGDFGNRADRLALRSSTLIGQRSGGRSDAAVCLKSAPLLSLFSPRGPWGVQVRRCIDAPPQQIPVEQKVERDTQKTISI